MCAEGVARAVDIHLHSTELYSILSARAAGVKAPNLLRRNLSYVDGSGRRALLEHGHSQALTLQLQAEDAGWQAGPGPGDTGQAPAATGGKAQAATPGSSIGSSSKDVIIAAVCVAFRHNGVEAYVPIAARATLVPPWAQQAPLTMQLPLGGSRPAAAGLVVVLMHQHSSRLACLVSLASRRPSSRAGGGKAVAASVTAALAFHMVASGSAVAYSVVDLDDLLGGSGGGGGGSSGAQQRRQQQGTLSKLEGVLTTHEPAASSTGTASTAQPFPWIQFDKQQQAGGSGCSGCGSSQPDAEVQFKYCLSIGDSCGGEGRMGQKQQQQPQGSGSCRAGRKRKADALIDCIQALPPAAAAAAAAAGEEPFPPQENGHAAAAAAGMAADQPGGLPQQHLQQQQGAQPPPPSQQQQHLQQQQQRRQRQPLLTFFFSSFDGSKTARAQARGFTCPLSCCRGLRCHSYAGLQQHMQASHSYHSCYFSDVMPGGDLEVYLRCKPAWCDVQGGFLPRQLAAGSLEAHPLTTLLAKTHITHPVMYHCPRQQRHLRLGPGGIYPADEEESRLEAEAEGLVAAHLAEADAAAEAAAAAGSGAAPSNSAPASSSMTAAATHTATATANGSRSQSRATAAAAAAVTSGRSGGGAAAAVVRQAGGSKAAVAAALRRNKAAAAAALRPPVKRKAAAPVRRTGTGLAPLTASGRPKFYHSQTCVAMTHDELLGAGGLDSDSEGDLAEWQRDCLERLQEKAELCPEERQFMMDWNLFLHKQPLYADADLPEAVQRFAAQHAQRLTADGPFRRCLLTFLLNLWRFRLLTPQQLHQLTSTLPPVVA